MALSGLPEDGELRLGSVILAEGRRMAVSDGFGDPVIWVTTQPVPTRAWPGLLRRMRRSALAWCPSSCRTWPRTSARRLTSPGLIT